MIVTDLREIKRAYMDGELINPECVCSVCNTRPVAKRESWRCESCAAQVRGMRADLMQRVG